MLELSVKISVKRSLHRWGERFSFNSQLLNESFLRVKSAIFKKY